MFEAPKNLIKAYRIQILLQTIIGIYTFSLRGNRLRRNLWAEIYTVILGLGFIFTVLMTFSTSLYTFLARIIGDSYLWMAIIGFELTFTNLAFPFMLCHSFINKNKHMDFLNRLADMDDLLVDKFKIEMTQVHYRLRRRSWTFLSLGLSYYMLISLIVAYGLHAQHLKEFWIYWYTLAYQAEQQSTGLLYSAMASSLYLLRTRFAILQKLWPPLMLATHDGQNEKRKKLRTKLDMSLWMVLFKELCSLLDLLSETWGILLLVRFMHDFTLLVTQMYVIYWIVLESQKKSYYWLAYVLVVTFWMMQNVLKILGISMSANFITMQVMLLKFIESEYVLL